MPGLANNIESQIVETQNCMICGEKLEYHTQAITLSCHFCEKRYAGYVSCSQGHAICEECHNQPAIESTKDICAGTESTDPFYIFNEILKSKNVTMLGCHHAFMVGGALLTAIKNTGTIEIKDEQLDELFARIGNQAISGYCGLTGVCGIAPAIGACFSILLGAKCGTDKEQKITMRVAAEISLAIAELTGPSCCKAYSWSALEIAGKILHQEMNVCLAGSEQKTVCDYSEEHPHGCRLEKCPYYP